MEKVDIIKEKLHKLEEDYDLLKPTTKEYLEKIETIIGEKEKRLDSINEDLNDCNYTTASIARDLDCSRTTLYKHNRLLQRYIELSKETTDKNNVLKQNEKLKDRVRELERQVDLMRSRDLDIIKINLKLGRVLNELAAKTKEVQELQERNLKKKNR